MWPNSWIYTLLKLMRSKTEYYMSKCEQLSTTAEPPLFDTVSPNTSFYQLWEPNIRWLMWPVFGKLLVWFSNLFSCFHFYTQKKIAVGNTAEGMCSSVTVRVSLMSCHVQNENENISRRNQIIFTWGHYLNANRKTTAVETLLINEKM